MSRGRVIVVTGAARGIGRGIADAMVEAGAAVSLLDREAAAVREAADELTGGGARAVGLEADVTDESSVEAALDETAGRLGPVDGLVNNAGVIELGPAIDATAESWLRQYRVNLEGTFTTSRAVARRLIEDGRPGAIVNVASNAGKVGYPNMAAYNATKAGVVNLTRSLAAEWAEHDINVNAVCPGGVDTPMLGDVASWFADRFGGDPDEILADMVPPQLGRHVQPIEVGRVVAFLLSDAASIIRGQAINTDGGETPY